MRLLHGCILRHRLDNTWFRFTIWFDDHRSWRCGWENFCDNIFFMWIFCYNLCNWIDISDKWNWRFRKNNKGRALLRTSEAFVFLMTKRLEIHERVILIGCFLSFRKYKTFRYLIIFFFGPSQGPAILETSPDRKEFCRTRPAVRPFQEAWLWVGIWRI